MQVLLLRSFFHGDPVLSQRCTLRESTFKLWSVYCKKVAAMWVGALPQKKQQMGRLLCQKEGPLVSGLEDSVCPPSSQSISVAVCHVTFSIWKNFLKTSWWRFCLMVRKEEMVADSLGFGSYANSLIVGWRGDILEGNGEGTRARVSDLNPGLSSHFLVVKFWIPWTCISGSSPRMFFQRDIIHPCNRLPPARSWPHKSVTLHPDQFEYLTGKRKRAGLA